MVKKLIIATIIFSNLAISQSFPKKNDSINASEYDIVEDLNTLFFEKTDEVLSYGHSHDYSDSRTPEGFIRCSTDELEAHLQVVNPRYIKKRDEFLEQIKINALNRSPMESTTITIPIVFHVLYYNQSDNLSKDYIAANFDQINLDFKNNNPDGIKIPSSANPSDAPYDASIDYSHSSERGAHNIQFVGVSGETEGSKLQEDVSIIRYNINKASVADLSDAAQLVNGTTADNGVQGGFKAGYMNIYIAPLGGKLLGQATLGGTTHCVVSNGSVGSVDFPGSASAFPYNLGRTLTHELGHNFTYNHIFISNNCGDQLWPDIPAQLNPNYSAEVYEYNGQWYGKDAGNSCISTSNKGDQFTNYMDYNADPDLIMFSSLQAVDGYNWASNVSWAQVDPSNGIPVANNMSINSYEDLEISITLSASDEDGDQLSYNVVGSPKYGTLDTSQLAIGGNIVIYTPDENWYGTDSFYFYVNDEVSTSSSAVVTLSLAAVNDQSNKFSAFGEYEIINEFEVKEVVKTDLLLATPEIESDSLVFKWEESTDVDGDVIEYRMIGYDSLEFLTMDTWTKNLSTAWSIKDLVANTDTVNTAFGSWAIEATDGEFFVLSNDGNPIDFSINGSALIPEDYLLLQNYPNPFNNSTTIRFNNPYPQKISIKIYDLAGALVHELINEEVNAGYNNIVWDGRNSDGESVSSGVYFYQIHAKKDSDGNKFIQTKKMLKLK